MSPVTIYERGGMTWGGHLPDSQLKRCWCEDCGTAMRDTPYQLWTDNNRTVRKLHYCELCAPRAAGCTSPPSPEDYDAYGAGAVSQQSQRPDG